MPMVKRSPGVRPRSLKTPKISLVIRSKFTILLYGELWTYGDSAEISPISRAPNLLAVKSKWKFRGHFITNIHDCRKNTVFDEA